MPAAAFLRTMRQCHHRAECCEIARRVIERLTRQMLRPFFDTRRAALRVRDAAC